MTDKRGFVHGLVASEDVSHQWATEQRKIANSMLRIEGAIRDCSRARHELVTMQKKMAAVVGQDEGSELRKKNVGEGLRAALGKDFAQHMHNMHTPLLGRQSLNL